MPQTLWEHQFAHWDWTKTYIGMPVGDISRDVLYVTDTYLLCTICTSPYAKGKRIFSHLWNMDSLHLAFIERLTYTLPVDIKAHFKKIKRSASPLSSNLFDFSATCCPSLLVVTEYTKIKTKIPSSLLNSDSSLWYTLFPFQTERFKCCHSVLNNLQKLSSFFWLIY